MESAKIHFFLFLFPLHNAHPGNLHQTVCYYVSVTSSVKTIIKMPFVNRSEFAFPSLARTPRAPLSTLAFLHDRHNGTLTKYVRKILDFWTPPTPLY